MENALGKRLAFARICTNRIGKRLSPSLSLSHTCNNADRIIRCPVCGSFTRYVQGGA